MPPPGSPLSPNMESLAIPSQARRRTPHNRQQSSTNSASLTLPPLPRFHPANFPSQHTSSATTPATGPNSPQPPLSPHTQQKQYSETQRQLYLYQRELIASASRSGRGAKPTSPRLIPTGSPGPVTPLELEGQGGYLMASSSASESASQSELVDKLIREEAKRRGEIAPSQPTSVGGR